MTVVVEGGDSGSEVAEESAEDIVEAAAEVAEDIVEAAADAAEAIVEAAADAADSGGSDADEIDRWVANEARHAEHERRIAELYERSWEAPSRDEVIAIAETVAEEVAEEATDVAVEGDDNEVTVVTPDVDEGKKKRRSWRDFY